MQKSGKAYVQHTLFDFRKCALVLLVIEQIKSDMGLINYLVKSLKTFKETFDIVDHHILKKIRIYGVAGILKNSLLLISITESNFINDISALDNNKWIRNFSKLKNIKSKAFREYSHLQGYVIRCEYSRRASF